MRKNAVKLVLIISMILNVVLAVVLYNNYKVDQTRHATGDPGAYRVFVHFLGYTSHYLGELEDNKEKSENMNSFINASQRLHISTTSFLTFKNSMSKTELQTDSIEISLENLNEKMGKLMSDYGFDKDGSIQRAKELMNEVDELVNKLPEAYDPQQQDEFIKLINDQF